MSDMGDGGSFGGWGLGTEVGPMAGSEWSKSDLEALKALGIIPDGAGGFRYGQNSGTISDGQKSSIEKLQGITSGGGPGITSGLGAQSPDNPSLDSPSSISRSGSSGISSSEEKSHYSPRPSRSFSSGGAPLAGYVPGGMWDQMNSWKPTPATRQNYLANLEYIYPKYTQEPQYSIGQGLRPATNFLEQLLRSRGGR
jgi:hypothetical protein